MQPPQLVFVGSPSTDRLNRGGRARTGVGGAAFISALAARVGGARVGLVARVPPVLPAAVARAFGPGGLNRGGLTPAAGSLPSFHITYDDVDRATYTHVDNGLEADLCAGDVPRTWLAADWLHLAAIGDDATRQLQVLAGLRERGVGGRISAGTYRRMIELNRTAALELLGAVDLFFCNAEEFELLCPEGPPADTTVCVTLGAGGVAVHGGPHAGHRKVRPVGVVDATGAGDAFCGGFLAGLVTGTDPVAAGESAARTALSGLGAEPLIEAVAAGVGPRAAIEPERIAAVAGALATAARASTLDFADPPHLPAGHPAALAMLCVSTMYQFGFWTGDPAAGWIGPMYAELDGTRYKGSDFVWAAFARAARTDPTLLSPERMAREPDLFERVCTADDGRCPLPHASAYAALQVAHAQRMLARWPGGYAALLEDCNACTTPVRRLLEHLATLPGYAEDPLAKKANLLAIALANRPERFLAARDRQHIRPIVDYHLMRGCLRTGCVTVLDPDLARRMELRQWVDAVEEHAVRSATHTAVEQLVTASGTSVAAVDGFFFRMGRRLCLETEDPRCSACPLDAVCAKRRWCFQPVFRTTHY